MSLTTMHHTGAILASYSKMMQRHVLSSRIERQARQAPLDLELRLLRLQIDALNQWIHCKVTGPAWDSWPKYLRRARAYSKDYLEPKLWKNLPKPAADYRRCKVKIQEQILAGFFIIRYSNTVFSVLGRYVRKIRTVKIQGHPVIRGADSKSTLLQQNDYWTDSRLFTPEPRYLKIFGLGASHTASSNASSLVRF